MIKNSEWGRAFVDHWRCLSSARPEILHRQRPVRRNGLDLGPERSRTAIAAIASTRASTREPRRQARRRRRRRRQEQEDGAKQHLRAAQQPQRPSQQPQDEPQVCPVPAWKERLLGRWNRTGAATLGASACGAGERLQHARLGGVEGPRRPARKKSSSPTRCSCSTTSSSTNACPGAAWRAPSSSKPKQPLR